MNARLLLSMLVLLTTIPAAGLAEKVELAPLTDTYISEGDPTANFVTSTTLSVRSLMIGMTDRALLSFDVSNLPYDAEINLAYLYLYDTSTNTANATVHEVTSWWIGNLVNWNNQPSYNSTGIGTLEGYAKAGWAYVDLTGLVRDWHAGTRSNHGAMITGGSMRNLKSPRSFHSQENATNPPKLVIIYDSDSVQLTPTADAHVSFADSLVNYGSNETLEIREQGLWSYLQFDATSLPAGATIEYARVRMYEYSGSSVNYGYPVGAHLVSSAWDESTINWTNKPTHYPWPAYVDGRVGLSSATGWIDFDVTSYVQTWYMTPSSNYGVMVGNPTDDSTSAAGPIGYFRSSEYGTAELRPVLEVFYSSPTPNTFGTPIPLTGVRESDAAWGDWDDDGDLDLVLCGETGAGCVTKTYENVGGTLTEVPNDIPGIKREFASGCIAWADFDNDGDLDLSLAGWTGSSHLTRIYVNDGTGAFTDSVTSLAQLRYASLAWGDWDNDGDLDLYIQGAYNTTVRSILYRNDGGTLTEAINFPTPIYGGSADWADWDGDGDLDLMTTGSTGSWRYTLFYRNDGGTFTSLGSRGLPDVCYSDMAWGDYDRDGDPDLAFVGEANKPALASYTRIYWNDGDGNLNHAWWLLGTAPQLRLGGCAWGDYDNDGRLDLAVCGYQQPGVALTQVYHNDAGNLVLDAGLSARGVYYGTVNWADVDNDADIDLLVTGRDLAGNNYTELYPNENSVPNTPPNAPNAFTTIRQPTGVPIIDRTLYIQWDGASDDETTDNGLTYCVRVGTWHGQDDIFSGTYGSPLMGNAGGENRMEIKIPDTDQHYFWSVKTIDTGLMASDWSAEQCSWAPDSIWTRQDYPTHDAFVDNLPERAEVPQHPLNPNLLVVGDYGNVYGASISRSYLKFNMSFLDTAKVKRVELYAYCRDANPNPGYMVSVFGENDDVWIETAIHWLNAPTAFHPYPWDIAEANSGQWSVWDVTRAVEAMGDNELTLVLRAYNPPEGFVCTPSCRYFAEFDSKEFDHPPYLLITYSTVVGADDTPVYTTLILGQNAPNPFNPQTRITYTVPEGTGGAPVSLRIYDVAGRLVRTLVDTVQRPGIHVLGWDGTNERGSRVSSGVYFYRLRCRGEAQTKKMILLK